MSLFVALNKRAEESWVSVEAVGKQALCPMGGWPWLDASPRSRLPGCGQRRLVALRAWRSAKQLFNALLLGCRWASSSS